MSTGNQMTAEEMLAEVERKRKEDGQEQLDTDLSVQFEVNREGAIRQGRTTFHLCYDDRRGQPSPRLLQGWRDRHFTVVLGRGDIGVSCDGTEPSVRE